MHKGKFSAEQLHTWANLIQMKKHASYDDPPDYPFFRGHAGQHAGHTSKENLPSHPEGVPPSQRLNMRSELIDQLGKCVSLREKGALSDEEYQELQKSIMTDIKSVSVPQ